MENEYTCARCGKPCPEGEFMCEECSAWLEGHAGTEEVSGFELEEIIRGKEPQEEPAPIPAAMPAVSAMEKRMCSIFLIRFMGSPLNYLFSLFSVSLFAS